MTTTPLPVDDHGEPSGAAPGGSPSSTTTAGALPTGRSAPTVLLVAVVVGLAWGAATSGLQTVLPASVQGFANGVAPWLAAAFAVGALARRPSVGVVAGLLACFGEVTGYDVVSMMRGFGVGTAEVVLWTAAGVLGGPVAGLAGQWWRRSRSRRLAAVGAALPGAVFLAEGVVSFGLVLHHVTNALSFVVVGLVLVVVLGAMTPAATTPRRGTLAAARWSLPLVVLGAAGEALLQLSVSR